MLPLSPPIETADLPEVGGHIGLALEDFSVDEVPLYPACGNGDHFYVRLRKQKLTTPELLQIVSRLSGVKERDIGCAGMKDKHAITTQWLSLPGNCPEPTEWALPPGVELLEHTRHTNKLRTGHLFGNRFKLRLIGMKTAALAHADAIAARLQREGLPNYFGAQRFGIQGRNLSSALHLLKNARPGQQHAGRFYSKFNPSVIQSELFNHYTRERLLLGRDQIFAGETVRLEGSPKTFLVEDASAERARLVAGDLHLTGPIFGSSSRMPIGRAGELLRASLQALNLSEEDIKGFGRDARGSVRDLIVPLTDLTLTHEESALGLEFSLPAGSYATQLIREFTRSDFLSGQRAQDLAQPLEQASHEAEDGARDVAE